MSHELVLGLGGCVDFEIAWDARVLEELEMTQHLEKRVDKLSGGQRKRASVALELLWFVLVDRASLGWRPLEPLTCSILEPGFWRHERFWKLGFAGDGVLMTALRGTPFMGLLWRMLGVRVGRLRGLVYGLGSLLTAVAVTTIGSVGFVGLIVPHLVRLAIGNDQRLLLPAATLAGGVLLTVADTAARTVVAPIQLPVGVLTALIGVPVFLFLLARHPR